MQCLSEICASLSLIHFRPEEADDLIAPPKSRRSFKRKVSEERQPLWLTNQVIPGL
jgi:hypothetical protein